MGLRPGLEVLEKRKKSLATVPGFELVDHPAHCLVCVMIILFFFLLIRYNYISIILPVLWCW
jgi:hypothetical protein